MRKTRLLRIVQYNYNIINKIVNVFKEFVHKNKKNKYKTDFILKI